MNITATIQVSVDYDDEGNPKQHHYEWQGPRNGVLGISGELMKMANSDLLKRPDNPTIGDVVEFGPYRLEIIGHQTQPAEIYFCLGNVDNVEFSGETTLEERIVASMQERSAE